MIIVALHLSSLNDDPPLSTLRSPRHEPLALENPHFELTRYAQWHHGFDPRHFTTSPAVLVFVFVDLPRAIFRDNGFELLELGGGCWCLVKRGRAIQEIRDGME